MKQLLMSVLVVAAIACSGQIAQAQQPGAPCGPRGLCGFLNDYLCCRQGYCGKPAPCPPSDCYPTCCLEYCKKPIPCPPQCCLQFCPDNYCRKPEPCCIPRPPCK